MNLWIFLALTWISFSVVIADPKWFVQDPPLVGEDADDLFSSEHLLLVQPKPKPKSKQVPQIYANKSLQLKAKPKPRIINKPTTTTAATTPTTSKPRKKPDLTDVEAEKFIPVGKTGRKPLGVIPDKQKVEPVAKVTVKNGKLASPVIKSTEDEAPCDTEKDIDCLMETEELIMVKKKKPAKPMPKIDTKPLIKHETPAPVKKEEKKTSPEKKQPKEIQRASLHRRLLDDENKNIVQQPSKPVLQPLLYEINDENENEDDLLSPEEEKAAADKNVEEILQRIRRQATGDEIGSGGGSFAPDTTPKPEVTYVIKLDTTFETPRTTPLTQADIDRYRDAFQTMLDNVLVPDGTNQYVGAVVTDVKLDENGRVVISWDLLMELSGAEGAAAEIRRQNALSFLRDTVVPNVNNLTLFDDPVYKPKELKKDVVEAIAKPKLGSVCQAEDPCIDGYVCQEVGLTSLCRHKCYSSGLIDRCQNGGACQLDEYFEPYCQCGTGFEGQHCETEIADTQPTYSTGQVIGASVGGGVAVVGAACMFFYLMLFRKKKEEDMEYSYFGDDDSSAPAFSDASSNLGISNYYISRPSVSITPLDIYHQNGNGAHA